MTIMDTPKSKYDLPQIDRIVEQFDKQILESLGFPVMRGGNVCCACPIHGGDNENAFTYKPSMKRWACWTNHCHAKHGNGLMGLVRCINRCTLDEACEYILKVTGQSGDEVTPNELERKLFVSEKLKSQCRIENIPDRIFNSEMFKYHCNKVQYFLDRGFSEETLKRFHAFYCDNREKPLYGRAVLPIMNEKDQIIGFSGRKTKAIDTSDKDENVPKWKHSTFQKTNHLFGLNIAKSEITARKVAILVEGPLDVMKMHEAGLTNTVSTFGNYLSENQKKLLMKYGARSVVVAFDPDEGGEIGTEDIIAKARLYFNVYDIRIILTDDPGDMSVEDIKKIIVPEIESIEHREKMRYGI